MFITTTSSCIVSVFKLKCFADDTLFLVFVFCRSDTERKDTLPAKVSYASGLSACDLYQSPVFAIFDLIYSS